MSFVDSGPNDWIESTAAIRAPARVVDGPDDWVTPPTQRPTASATGADDWITPPAPPARREMPSFSDVATRALETALPPAAAIRAARELVPTGLESAQHGAQHAIRSLSQLPGAVSQTGTVDEEPPNYPEAQPIEAADALSPGSKLIPKMIYGAAASSPTLAAAAGGGAVGGLAGGPMGALAGTVVGASAMSAAQSIGPYYQAALKEGGNPDQAYSHAVEMAAADGVISGAAFAAFGWTPFNGFVKNILFQSVGPQPSIAAGGRMAKNVMEGRPFEEGAAEEIPGAIVNSLVPAAAMHGMRALVQGRATPEAGQPQPQGTSPEMEAAIGEARGRQTRADIDAFMQQRAGQEVAGTRDPRAPVLALPSPEQPTAPVQAATVPPQSPPGAPMAPDAERNALIRYGYTPAQIDTMAPEMRAAEYQNAVASGVVAPAEQIPQQNQHAPTGAVTARPLEGEILAPQNGNFEQVPWTANDGNPWGMSDADYAVWKQQPENRAAVEQWNRDNKIVEHEPTRPAPKRSLDDLLADPRSVAEIRAADEAAANWQPTDDWQAVPQGATLPPGVDIEVNPATGEQRARIAPAPGSREAPVRLETPADVHAGAEQTAQPTPAQAEAGNYPKRHVKWNGLDISIETEAGQQRTGISPQGAPWSVTMPAPYGYIKRTTGRDGDHLDVYVGPQPRARQVFVVDQIDPDSLKFDEHKILAGFPDQASALQAYQAAFSDGSGPMRIGGVTAMGVPAFKAWVASGDTKKPLAYEPPRVPRKASQRGPLSLFEFLASNGGIRDHAGELRAMDLHRAFIPGYGSLVRPGGKPLDTAREAAVEAGYMRDTPWEGGLAKTTIPDLLGLLDQEARGQKVYSEGDLAEVAKRHAERQAKESVRQHKEAETAVRSVAKAEGLIATDLDIRDAARMALEHGADPLDALVDTLERSALAHHQELVDTQSSEVSHAAVERTGTNEAGARLAQAGEHASRPQPPAAPDRAPARGEPSADQQHRGAERPAAATAAAATPSAKPAGTVERPRVLDFDQFAAERGAAGGFISEAGMHRGRAGQSERAKQAALSRLAATNEAHTTKRNDLRSEYEALVASGEIRPPTRTERLEKTAQGNEENPSVQAARRLLEKTPLTERTPAGAQHVLPGAEKAPDKDLAQRRAEQPLKPKVAQKLADTGLFSDEGKQTDLVDMAREPPPKPAQNIPENIPTKLFRGTGRADIAGPYNKSPLANATPILGNAQYFAFKRDVAEGYGPKIETADLSGLMSNPLIVRSGQEWQALTKGAGWQTPNPFGRPRAQLDNDIATLRQNIEAKGHDGVIVWWDDKTPYDVGPKGENIKLLRNVFGDPQVVDFKPPAATKSEKPPQPSTTKAPSAGPSDSGVQASLRRGADPQAVAEQLKGLRADRAAFDARLATLESELTGEQLRSVVEAFAGYKPVAKSKSELVATLKRNQRQTELNSDRARAQDKIRPSIRAGGGLTPAARQRRADIERMLSQIVSKLAGRNVRIEFADKLPMPSATTGWGSHVAQTAAGLYDPARALIKLAMADPQYAGNPTTTAFHEAFHAVEHQLLNAKEMELLQKETPRLREWIKKNLDLSNDGKKADASWADDIAPYEVRAIAFETYAMGRGEGKPINGFHTGIARLFNRLMLLLQRIRNALRGMGFKTTEDVFSDVYEEKMAGREPVRGPNAKVEAEPQYSLRREPETAAGRETSKLRTLADRAIELVGEAQMKVAPMAVGSTDATAAAKDYANAVRLARHEWSRRDDLIKKNYTPEQRKAMWEAADHESVAEQTGATLGADQGLASLTPEQRMVVEGLQDEANAAWRQAQDVGIVKAESEGLPSYVPRMVVMMNEGGHFGRPPSGDAKVGNSEGIGRGFRTSTGQVKQRKYTTAAETEAAMKARFGETAQIAKDIRALSLATAKLREAIAARAFVNKIKAVGNLTGEQTVSEGAEPQDGHRWFTLDHPAFKTYRPKMEEADTQTYRDAVERAGGAVERSLIPARDAHGDIIFERVPLYIRSDFKGPLLAVMGKDTGKIYNAVMALKGKAMSMIMYSPAIHNVVEYSRALPAYPLKVATTWIYFEGNRAKNDPTQMREAISAGLVPIGKRFFNQEISSIMEEPNLAPGRSWTAQVARFVPDLFDPARPGTIVGGPGDKVAAAIDKAGDFWHNTLLWDRIGDLQMGLYVNMRRDLIGKGHDAQTAARVAAHFANRYAGALPIEAMSTGARKLANLMLFSRTFTFGNLGAMKDALTGLPRDVQAQIMRDAGPAALGKIKNFAKRKSASIIMLDIALGFLVTTILQDVMKKLRGEKDWPELFGDYIGRFLKLVEGTSDHPLNTVLHPIDALWRLSSTATNEPRKREGIEARVLLYYDKNGRAVYGRNPMGKIGEEFTGWPTAPGDMIMRKLSTFVRPVMQSILNDKYAGAGFDRPTRIWRPNPEGAEWFKNMGRIALHFMEAQLPIDALRSGADLMDDGSKKDALTSKLKILAPLAGISISQGHPGGMRGAIQEQRRQEKGLDKRFAQ